MTAPLDQQQLGYVLAHLGGAVAALEHARHMAEPLVRTEDADDQSVRDLIDGLLDNARYTQVRIRALKQSRS